MESRVYYPVCRSYKFNTYDEYYEVIYPKLTKLIHEYLADDEHEHYHIAIDELVCNAVRYMLPGKPLEVDIGIRVWEDSISCTVQSESQPWDAAALQARLRELAKNTEICEMNWGEYVGEDAARGRGVYLVLMTAEYFIIDPKEHSATIICRRPFKYNNISTKIKDIVPRFLIKNEGVIT